MRLMNITRKKAAMAAVGVVGALAVSGTAYAATGSGSGAPATNSPAGSAPAVKPAGGKADRSLLQRADHATVEVKVKGKWVTYTLDRGKVTAVSPTSITLARPDGQSVTDSIDSRTRYGGVSSEAAIQLNRPATVLSDGGAALRVRQATKPGNGPA